MSDRREEIFRRVVVERLSSPDQLDQMLQVLRPRSWWSLAAIGLLFAGALAWSLTGRVAVTVPAAGLLLPAGGLVELTAPERGRALSLAAAGDLLDAEVPAVTLAVRTAVGAAPPVDGRLPLGLPFAARVLETFVGPGEWVEQGAPLLVAERAGEELRAVLFVDDAAARELRPGLTAWVAPPGGAESGDALRGEVIAVAAHPATARGLEALLADDELCARLIAAGRRWRVDVRLPPAASGAAGLPRTSRTEVEARLVVREVPPLAAIAPWIEAGGR